MKINIVSIRRHSNLSSSKKDNLKENAKKAYLKQWATGIWLWIGFMLRFLLGRITACWLRDRLCFIILLH